nr:unnamed protein product [Callosobruchus chinensis]
MDFLYRDYWTRPLTLSELMEEVENTNLDSDLIPEEIIIFQPADGGVTDEDSGEEDNVVINNLPGVQPRTLTEVVLPNTENASDFDSEDDLPLSRFLKRQKVSRAKKKHTEVLAWTKNDITSNMPRRIVAVGILESFKKRQLLLGSRELPKHAHLYSRYDGMDHMVLNQDKQTRCASCHKNAIFCVKNVSTSP